MPKDRKAPGAEKPKSKAKSGDVRAAAGDIEVLESTSSLKLGVAQNRTEFVLNLDRTCPTSKRSGGADVPGQLPPVASMGYVLPNGKKIPTAVGSETDPRPRMVAMKSHSVRFENVSAQAVSLDVKKRLASAESNTAAAATVDILSEKVLGPGKSHTVTLDMTYQGVRLDDAASQVDVEELMELRVNRTDQLDDSLTNLENGVRVMNPDADMVRITIVSEYYGDSSSRVEGAFHVLNFASDFPEPSTYASATPSARNRSIKLGKRVVGYQGTAKASSIITLEYDVSLTGTGLGYDRITANINGSSRSIYVLAVTKADDNAAWDPIAAQSWSSYAIHAKGSGGLNYDENGDDAPNLAGGVAVWYPSLSKYVMWDFARNKPVTCERGYDATNGYGAYRYGSLPPKGVVEASLLPAAVLRKIRGEPEPKIAFSTVLLGIAFIRDLITLSREFYQAYHNAQATADKAVMREISRPYTEEELNANRRVR